MARKSTGKRLRFEIFKRDGFRCRYCGANASTVTLHVDHVVPVSNGGTDDPANLITACAPCNGGKSNVGLEESQLPGQQQTTDEALEHAEQIRGYLEAQRAVQDAKEAVYEYVCDHWRNCFGENPTMEFYRRLPGALAQNELHELLEAVDAVCSAWMNNNLRERKFLPYFNSVLKRMREQRGG